MTDFTPTRDAALSRLDAFIPHAGADYARLRNFDAPGHPHVSLLSPYLRHRLITEEEVLRATLAHHSAEQAQKFIAEVIWRTYWKGVLELRPALWTYYKADLNAAWNQVQTNGGLRADWEAACTGNTGIDCFDHWAKELATTGYLHNHARMWFASIWIFTLRLPWVLGADFFLRHLLDGDPASNTLSWRWVGGLQTKGKTYLARPDNIAKFTQGRFNPKGLASFAAPLDGPDLPPVGIPPVSDARPTGGKTGLLMTSEDMSATFKYDACDSIAMLIPKTPDGPLIADQKLCDFQQACMQDLGGRLAKPVIDVCDVSEIAQWAKDADLDHVIMAYVPVGHVKDRLFDLRVTLKELGINLCVQLRQYDATAWPKATHGFFRFKDVTPVLVSGLS